MYIWLARGGAPTHPLTPSSPTLSKLTLTLVLNLVLTLKCIQALHQTLGVSLTFTLGVDLSLSL